MSDRVAQAWGLLPEYLAWHVLLSASALGLGLASGEDIAKVLKSVITGFGDIVANVGIVLAFGAMFGGLLAKSRGADRIASSLITARGLHFAPWAMAGLDQSYRTRARTPSRM